MNDMKQSDHFHEGSEDDVAKKTHHPYWKRAHRDWRIWFAVFVMIVCMIIYAITIDFTMLPRSRPQTPQSGAVRK